MPQKKILKDDGLIPLWTPWKREKDKTRQKMENVTLVNKSEFRERNLKLSKRNSKWYATYGYGIKSQGFTNPIEAAAEALELAISNGIGLNEKTYVKSYIREWKGSKQNIYSSAKDVEIHRYRLLFEP